MPNQYQQAPPPYQAPPYQAPLHPQSPPRVVTNQTVNMTGTITFEAAVMYVAFLSINISLMASNIAQVKMLDQMPRGVDVETGPDMKAMLKASMALQIMAILLSCFLYCCIDSQPHGYQVRCGQGIVTYWVPTVILIVTCIIYVIVVVLNCVVASLGLPLKE